MSRSRHRWYLASILLAGTITGCGFTPADIESLAGTGRVYFVPLEEFPASLRNDLVDYYADKYGLRIEVLSTVRLDSRSFDSQRRQIVAEEAIRRMAESQSILAADPEAILIGLTSKDMFIRKKTWGFAFSYREQGRFAVVSSGRMHIGLAKGEHERFESRVRKMVTKNIGLLHYRLAPSPDPRSVLYRNVLGIEELDAMGEEF